MSIRHERMEACKGCYSRGQNPTCHSMHYLKTNMCPCTICIVKVMCRESCAEHTSYWWGVDSATRKDPPQKGNYI